MFNPRCRSVSLGCLCLASLSIFCQRAGADTWTGKVVKVADGDTVTVLRQKRQIKVRLHGVDTPEKAQAFGQRAKKFTLALVGGKTVRVKVMATDRYGRTVGVVHVGAKCLNEALLRAGLAWHYKRYSKSKRYAALEAEARRKKRGLWADKDPTPPWIWRRQNRPFRGGPGRATSPRPPRPSTGRCTSAAVHGNVKSKVFHTCSCRAFTCKNCKARFANASAAEGQGFKGHEKCTIGHPGVPYRLERACRNDRDCVLAPTPRCQCDCGLRWRKAHNRKAHKRALKRRERTDGKCVCSSACRTRWKGTKAACVKGQCVTR